MDDKANEQINEFAKSTGRHPEESAPTWESSHNIAPTEDIQQLLDSVKTGKLRFGRARSSSVPGWSKSLS